MKTFLLVVCALAIAIPATWFAAHHHEDPAAATLSPQRHVKYYQSAMHPQIKSDKPGRCPICGMELTPIYEDSPGIDSDPSLVTLSPVSQRVLHVETAQARKAALEKTLRVAGSIEENDTRHKMLSAVVDGRIEKLHINTVGAEIKAGQPLAELFSPALLQAEREYKSLAGDLRQRAALRLRQMGLSVEQINALAGKTEDTLVSTISSPISGSVIVKKAYEGQYVKEGEILFEIADFSTMWFVFQAYETDLPWLHTGLSVDITTPSLPGRTLTGHISFVDPNFDESTRSTKVRVELPNSIENGQRLLSHRIFADAVVHTDSREILTVPRAAVLETGRMALVYVDRGNGNYQRREVKTGRRGDTTIEVLDGLKEGDPVVTQGNLLIDGQAEINRSSQPPDDMETAKTSAATSPPWTTEQSSAFSAYLKNSDAMADALGHDKLAGFQQAAAQTPAAARQVVTAFANRRDMIDVFASLADAPELQTVPDLKSARAAYHHYITRVVAVVTPLRKREGAPKFDIWECGMADKAIPGIPKKARWIQIPGRPGTNPFYGQDMPDCGELIQP